MEYDENSVGVHYSETANKMILHMGIFRQLNDYDITETLEKIFLEGVRLGVEIEKKREEGNRLQSGLFYPSYNNEEYIF